MSVSRRRQSILEAAARLFGHYGPTKTTIGDIAREAGIGVGSVYLEFASKDEIVSELASERHQRVIVTMRNAAKRGDHASRLAAALEARVKVMLELASDGAHACDLMACGGSDRGAARPTRTGPGGFADEERELVVALLRAGVEAAEFDPVDPVDLAAVIEQAYAVLSPPWLFCHEAAEATRLAGTLGRLLVFGLKARAEPAPQAPNEPTPRKQTKRRR